MKKSQKTEGDQITECGVTGARTRKGGNDTGPGSSSTCGVAVEEDGGERRPFGFLAGRRPSEHRSPSSTVGCGMASVFSPVFVMMLQFLSSRSDLTAVRRCLAH